MINKHRTNQKQNTGWMVVMIISLVISLLGFTFSAMSAYSVWLDYKSIGAHKFVTTGVVKSKEVNEKTGRRSYRTVNKHYAVFQTADGKYLHDGEITPTQKSRINRGSRYSRMYEVFVDRNGGYKAVAMNKASKPGENGGTNFVIFFVIAAVCALAGYGAFRKWRPKLQPGIIS